MQYYVIKFVSVLRRVDGFLQALRFPSPIKLTIAEIVVESDAKHHNHNPNHTTINSFYKMDKLKSFITGTM